MRISADTERRVREAARELDYRPNLLARGLGTNHSRTIGFVSDTIASDAFGGAMIRSSLVTALDNDHLLFVGESGGDPAVESQVIQGMLDRGVGGFIYASMYTRRVELNLLLAAQPVVLLNCVALDAQVATVIPAEVDGGRTAARTLLTRGHFEGIYLVGEAPDHVLAATERLAGIESALAEADAGIAGHVPSLWWPRPAYEGVRRLLSSGATPTAFICMNDRVAMGTYQACQDEGLVIPDDISVISFDDSDLASWCRPKITSIALPHHEMGRRATEQLLGDEPVAGTQRVEMRLVERESVAHRGGISGSTLA
jgi:LacI family transcriptional regulator